MLRLRPAPAPKAAIRVAVVALLTRQWCGGGLCRVHRHRRTGAPPRTRRDRDFAPVPEAAVLAAKTAAGLPVR